MRINLLPPEILKRREAQKHFILTTIVVVIIFVFFAVTYLALSWRLYNENSILAQIEADNIKLQKTLNEYKEFETWQAELKQRREILNKALEAEVRWSFILDEMSIVIPTDIWLAEFSGDASENLSFKGYAFSHPSVAKWMVRQADIKKINNIDLVYSELTDLNDIPVINFETTAELVFAAPKTATSSADPKVGGV